jgi:hypothetical protein
MAGKRNWFGILRLVDSRVRIRLLVALWPILTADERYDAFVDWLCQCESRCQCYEFLLEALGEFARSGRRISDTHASRERFADLPDVVRIYRASTEDEIVERAFGVSWTLNRDIVIPFAAEHRFRNHRYASVLLAAKVKREAIAGLLVDRGDDEVLILPDNVLEYDVEGLALTG